jgi:hypothetical protein
LETLKSRKDIQLTPVYDLHTKCLGEKWQKNGKVGLKQVNDEKVVLKKSA